MGTPPMSLSPAPPDTTARGPLMLSPRPRLTLMLCTDTTATPMDTVLTDTDMDTPTDTDTTARGPLSPRPRLRLMPLFCTELTDTPMVSVPTAMALSVMPATPMFMALESLPPTMSSDTPLLTPPVA